ncbi:hypothetical protein QFC24_004510 [Naganishia onofrii]|uniref:Uncharacterized protein n=1 Tax=Naganishia onofrii TaxID=1851511 RepID=A0ACC2XCZ7_9TREE|nr:hypothetical protein QFC24_004510 [Naganishia onofrii]
MGKTNKIVAYNRPQYPIMNEWVASRLSYAPSDSNWYLRPTRHALRYMDLWKTSIQRPDSKLKPRIDCLHYCSPGVPNEWLGFMWHMMITQAENGDYDDPPLGDSWIAAGMPT